MKNTLFHIVTSILLLLFLVGAGVYWGGATCYANSLESIRVPEVTLTTTGLTKSEQISSSDSGVMDQCYRPRSRPGLIPSGSFIQVDATYRYEVALRNTWSMVFDSNRKVAFIIIPMISARLPVEYEIRHDDTVIGGVHIDSKWFWKFEDMDQIKKRTALLKALDALLAEKAKTADYIALRKDEARQIVETYISEWLIKQGRCTASDQPIVKVYFQDDKDPRFPLPPGKTLVDFKP